MSLSKILVNNTQVIEVDNEPTIDSENLVQSGGICDAIDDAVYKIEKKSVKTLNSEICDLGFTDSRLNMILMLKNGHIYSKNFSSDNHYEIEDNSIEQKKLKTDCVKSNAKPADSFDIVDSTKNQNVLIRFSDGNIRTKKFDSSTIVSSVNDHETRITQLEESPVSGLKISSPLNNKIWTACGDSYTDSGFYDPTNPNNNDSNRRPI